MTLRIGSLRPTLVSGNRSISLLPLNAEPPQIFNHGCGKFSTGSERIEVPAAKHQHAMGGTRPVIRRQESLCMTKMQ